MRTTAPTPIYMRIPPLASCLLTYRIYAARKPSPNAHGRGRRCARRCTCFGRRGTESLIFGYRAHTFVVGALAGMLRMFEAVQQRRRSMAEGRYDELKGRAKL